MNIFRDLQVVLQHIVTMSTDKLRKLKTYIQKWVSEEEESETSDKKDYWD